MRVPDFFCFVHFSRGTLPTKKGVREGTAGGPRSPYLSFWEVRVLTKKMSCPQITFRGLNGKPTTP